MSQTVLRRELPVSTDEKALIRGFIFACTQNSERECLSRLLFATEKLYGPVVIRIREGDLLFLHNLDTGILHGVFKAVSNGSFNIQANAFGGRYPYQVRVEPIGETIKIAGAEKILKYFGVNRNNPLFRKKLSDLLAAFIQPGQPALETMSNMNSTRDLIAREIENIRSSGAKIDIDDEISLIEATTFWDFPRQSYGLTSKGDNRYAGVTPALIIYNLVWRYTAPDDLVVDPMCGSGTTIDVCKEEKRRVIGYDIKSTRPDIIKNDARHIPLDDNSVDMVFIDSPYGDNIKYNEESANIGNISSESDEFYDELEQVMRESRRILKEGKVLGWLIGDQWVKKKFTPVGFKIYERLCKHFEPVDMICVSRRGQSSNTGVWQNRARRFNFYLRGFKYLIIVRKITATNISEKPRKITWGRYARGGETNNEY